MAFLIIALAIIATSSSHAIPLPSSPVGVTPHLHPIQSLYHSQDNLGQYVYGYATPTSTKAESKSADGITHGGYSYIDSNGHLQTVQYTADAVNGFRVAATNLPQDLPEVAAARLQHLHDFAAIKNEHDQIAAVRYSNPVAVPVAAVLPQPVQDLPEVVAARAQHLAAVQRAHSLYQHRAHLVAPQPVQDLPEVVKARAQHLATFEATKARDAALQAQISLSPIPEVIHDNGVVPIHTAYEATAAAAPAITPLVSYQPLSILGSSQYHTQDDWGQYSYGYVNPHSAKSEVKTADGVVRGGYSYIDAHGVLQTVNYIADALGFRVAATNLPTDASKVVANHPELLAAPKAVYTSQIVY